jgi:hypothetical protein
MLWTSMRFDDTLGLVPSKLHLFDRGLEGLIVRSKASGPTKKIAELRIFIAREATVTGEPWLETGFEIWSETASFAFDRDYFLPMPNPDLSGCIHSEARYTDAAAIARAVLADLPRVSYDNLLSRWRRDEGGQNLLLTAEAVSFWKLHGMRNFLKSAALSAGIASDRTNFLGRWKAQSSDEYVRTSRQIILETQRIVAQKAANNPTFLDEEDVIHDLLESLRRSGRSEAEIRDQKELLITTATKGPFDIGNVPEAAPENEIDSELPVSEFLENEDSRRDDPELQQASASSADEIDKEWHEYWTSTSSKRKEAKLHITGFCSFNPGTNVKEYAWADSPEEATWSSLCSRCWKGIPEPLAGEVQAPVPSEAVTSSSSSSSSSSTSEGLEEAR